ncbi:hypothetical protein A9Q84_06770 [Halobacteriovorax marinus]|uniref:DUF4286 domain-containing protein n=1 Tax=Halobacteriovorax marinus TaxID=97084 RepID=A0A1Y5FFG0_9BACT|nr:hypothetical protein A9Q84_06770 [Halobacteriovorax marinus]
MVEYEVTINVQEEIFDAYMIWLKDHIKEMLTIEGFSDAKYYNVDVANEKIVCVRYFVESKELLQKYLDETSKKMRKSYKNEFENKFSISRRILNEGDI